MATCSGLCTDFPPLPILATGVSPDAPGMFGAPSGSGPCVTEPEDGTLFPRNWLRPRVRVPGATGLLKITLHAEREANDLVAYARGETWVLPKDIWSALARHVVDEDVSLTVQTLAGGATTLKFRIAPAAANGSIVFFSLDPAQAGKTAIESMPAASIANDATLKGFSVADEGTVDVLKITDVAQPAGMQAGATQASHCTGCHAGTPDGEFVGFVDAWPWTAGFAAVKPDASGKTGAALPGIVGGSCTSWNVCASPRSFVQFPWAGPMAFSAAHWVAGDRKAIIATQMASITMPWSTDNWRPGRLAWIDLESTATTMVNGAVIPTEGQAFGYLARTGDPHPAAAFPAWSHDGTSIVYASTACPSPGQVNGCGTADARLARGATDLYEIPFANKAGGAATPVAGAATTTLEEYYPAYSPDDRLIAYTAVPAGQEMYANPSAELYIVRRASGSAAIRLRANNPPACSGKSSPGVNNHWPRWAPEAISSAGRTYYWLVFSNNRYGLADVTTTFNGTTKVVAVSQLYVTAVVIDETSVSTYPGIYLWNQPQNRLNTTPAWENFHIPAVVD